MNKLPINISQINKLQINDYIRFYNLYDLPHINLSAESMGFEPTSSRVTIWYPKPLDDDS